MIEVLKHGNKKQIITRCPSCGCVFRFDDETDTYHDRIFCGDYVDCPECGEQIQVHDTSCHNDNPHNFECEIIDEDELDELD